VTASFLGSPHLAIVCAGLGFSTFSYVSAELKVAYYEYLSHLNPQGEFEEDMGEELQLDLLNRVCTLAPINCRMVVTPTCGINVGFVLFPD
jgi:hypothetical protein